MTPTPPSTSSSHGPNSPDFRVVRKRNRVALSCGPCRHRKLKCNRTNPCENCTRRGDASSCSYAAPGTRKKNQSQGATSPNDMQNRIDRLEGLVLSLMTNGAQAAGPTAAAQALSRSQSDDASSSFPPGRDHDDDNDAMIKEEDEDESEVEGVTQSLGILKVDADQGKSLYVGDSHWHLVLADIAEVKTYFQAHKKDIEKSYERIRLSKNPTNSGGPALLFSSETVTDTELRSELPAKSAVDKLVTRYFNSYDPAVHIIHAPTFQRELERHWQREKEKDTPMVWLGLLYSIMCLAMQSYHKIGDEPFEWKGQTQELAARFRMRTVQCLVNSDYTKSSIYTIETLILYVNGEYAVRWDAEVSIWVVISMIVRLAIRMGYHRDPSNYNTVGLFEGEMRRRIWATVRQMDIMFSFQLALPGMIRAGSCDVALPRNIFEDEFGPDSKTLPPSRPPSEPTPISYMITQTQLTYEFGEILEEINTVSGKQVTYEDVLKRDSRLRELRDNMAPHLRLCPIEQCTHDPATLLMQRFNIDTMFQKTVCVLHRKYIGRQNCRYAPSRRACVDAAIKILQHQVTLQKESNPGGRMHTMKWFISSLTKHDYLLGAMIVCLDLNTAKVAKSMPANSAGYNPNFWSPAQQAEMLKALEDSAKLWKAGADQSMEAYKASAVLEVMLQKLHSPAIPRQNVPVSPQGPTSSEVFAQFDEDLQPEHSAAMTLGMLSGGLTPNTAAFFNNGVGSSPNRYGNIDMNMGGDMTNMNGGTGLTPYAMDVQNPFTTMGNNPASPFSVFGNMGVGTGAGFDPPINLDWEAWDQYIQNGNVLDLNFPFYPTNPDAQDPTFQQGVQQPQSDQNQNQGYSNSVFMGANIPGK